MKILIDKATVEQTLEALGFESWTTQEEDTIKAKVKTALKEALAQPTSGYAKKIEELIQERDALRALAQPEERNFCPRCGKRTADLTTIHTCTPPQKKNT